jgi:CHAD domain-containing protein
MALRNASLEQWAQSIIHRQIESAGDALQEYCAKPNSAKRLHAARKALARLRSALEDLGVLAGVAPLFLERVHELHRRAGKVRDADVLLKRIDEYCERAFDNERKELKRLSRDIGKRRNRQFVKLERVIAGTVPELRP